MDPTDDPGDAATMILAETFQFTPEEQRVLLLIGAIVLAVLAAAGALAVAGVIAGYRAGRDPSRTTARRIWVAALVVEATVTVPALASLEPFWVGSSAVLLGITAGAHALGRVVRRERELSR